MTIPTIAAIADERVLAGSVIRDPDSLDDVRGLVQPDDFADFPARLVYETACKLRDAGRWVDAASVLMELRRLGRAEDLGHNPGGFLGDLLELAPTAANAVPAAAQVRDAAQRRAAVALAAELMRDAADPTGPTDELVETFLRKMAAVTETCNPADEPEPVGKVLARAAERYDALARGEGQQPIPTGFPELDRVLVGGLRPEGLVLVGARPGKGKSVMLRQIATNAATATGNRPAYPTLWFGLEMSTDETADRLVADKAGVPLARLRGASPMNQDEAERVAGLTAGGWLAGLPLYLDQRKRLTVAKIAATARRYVRKHGVKLVAIDYLQLVQPEDRRAARYEQVGQISRDLKVLAGELKVVVLAAVQVSREAAGGSVELHHLRESGSLEQDADTVLLLNPHADDTPPGGVSRYALKVGKQRSGMDGVTIDLLFNGKFTRFEPAGIPTM